MYSVIWCLSIIFCLLFQCYSATKISWPVPYKRFSKRPPNDLFCQAKYTFCPTGLEHGQMPKFDGDDIIEVFALKAPVWEFKYGDLLKHFNIMHDAIGFRSRKLNINYTIEWYELDQLFNCTFPHINNKTNIKWCNQGASCIYKGIDDHHWLDNGTLVKVGEMNGIQFKNYSDYVLWDNTTGIFYETWTVMEKKDGTTWFKAHDCATFVLDSFKKMGEIGVKFNKSIQLNYTKIVIFSEMPIYLGNITYIKLNDTVYKEILLFYKNLQVPKSMSNAAENVLKFVFEVFLQRKFYLFYNYEYWFLPLKPPFFKLIYEESFLP